MTFFVKIQKLFNIIKVSFKKISKKPYRIFGKFSDSFGNNFDLLQGLRDDLKPGWQTMIKNQKELPPNRQTLESLVPYFSKRIIKMNKFLYDCGLSIKQKNILEIGCDNGLTSYLLLSNGAKKVVGSDIVVQKHGDMIKKLIVESSLLSQKQISNIDLIKDNICNSTLPPNSFDFICSFEVLEHLIKPEKAFLNIHRLLKKGGFMFHEYNPFFCVTGGHSLCTLDFYWGHVRLNSRDFNRYITKIRPDEKNIALDFYQKSLNRMTFHKLEVICAKTGFKPVSIIKWPSEQDFNLVNQEILSQVKRNYPTVSISDLITSKIWVLYKKE